MFPTFGHWNLVLRILVGIWDLVLGIFSIRYWNLEKMKVNPACIAG